MTGSIFTRFAPLALALLITAGAQAATVSTTLTLTGSATLNSSGAYVVTGTATLTNVGSGGSTLKRSVRQYDSHRKHWGDVGGTFYDRDQQRQYTDRNLGAVDLRTERNRHWILDHHGWHRQLRGVYRKYPFPVGDRFDFGDRPHDEL